MRGKSKIKVEELNQRLKQLTGCPDDVDLRKMTLNEVEDLISSSRLRMIERLRNMGGTNLRVPLKQECFDTIFKNILKNTLYEGFHRVFHLI